MGKLTLESKVPHSKLWGITGKGAALPQVTNGAAFLPPASWGVSSGDFYEFEEVLLNQENNGISHQPLLTLSVQS